MLSIFCTHVYTPVVHLPSSVQPSIDIFQNLRIQSEPDRPSIFHKGKKKTKKNKILIPFSPPRNEATSMGQGFLALFFIFPQQVPPRILPFVPTNTQQRVIQLHHRKRKGFPFRSIPEIRSPYPATNFYRPSLPADQFFPQIRFLAEYPEN